MPILLCLLPQSTAIVYVDAERAPTERFKFDYFFDFAGFSALWNAAWIGLDIVTEILNDSLVVD